MVCVSNVLCEFALFLAFVATVNAIKYCNATPHFYDADKNTLSIDLEKFENYLKKYTYLTKNKCINKILGKLDDKPIYITFDLDCLDCTVAPAVSNLEPAFNGFNMDEAKKLLQSLKGKNIIGGDVVCLMPTKDQPNNITSMVASSIMFEIICLVSESLK